MCTSHYFPCSLWIKAIPCCLLGEIKDYGLLFVAFPVVRCWLLSPALPTSPFLQRNTIGPRHAFACKKTKAPSPMFPKIPFAVQLCGRLFVDGGSEKQMFPVSCLAAVQPSFQGALPILTQGIPAEAVRRSTSVALGIPDSGL